MTIVIALFDSDPQMISNLFVTTKKVMRNLTFWQTQKMRKQMTVRREILKEMKQKLKKKNPAQVKMSLI